jgi:hypothetical protein
MSGKCKVHLLADFSSTFAITSTAVVPLFLSTRIGEFATFACSATLPEAIIDTP